MRDHLGIGLRAELGAVVFQFLAQLAEVLDDAVVHHRQPIGGVRMRIILARPPVGGPTRVADADASLEWLSLQLGFKVAKLAFGAAPGQPARFERSHARRIVAAVFEAFERIDKMLRDRLAPEDADNSAHSGPADRKSTRLNSSHLGISYAVFCLKKK